YQQPIWTGHADFIHPFEFTQFIRDAFVEPGTPRFDVMIEAKAKDIALLRLRRDLSRYAPDVATRFGLAGLPETDDTEYYDDASETGNETGDKMVE
ncbi:MAG: UV DNA damage repair endonuclease UvsE, partial [Fibrella sp.]|nr:UV DNA damage repair endonuclease UvsE [Armatimonadota bacterium]